MAVRYAVGIDLGGTRIKGALVDGQGNLVTATKTGTAAAQGVDAVIERIRRLIAELLRSVPKGGTVVGIGLAVPGVIDMPSGTVLFLPNLPGGWSNVPLARLVGEHFGLPTHLLNDARAATLGEKRFGAGRNSRNMVCLTLGTGIGGGIIINDQLYFGSEGTAGEVGHQTVELHGPPCNCGNEGCVEALASGPALAALAVKAVMQGTTTKIRDLAEGDLNRITPKLVSQAAAAGDPVALDIIRKVGGYIGTAIANLVAVLNPDTVVVGGGVAQAGPPLFEAIEATVARRVHVAKGGRGNVAIVPAGLGEEAGVAGAAAWALERARR